MAGQLGAVVIGATALHRLEPGARRREVAWLGIALGIVGTLGTCVTFGVLTG